MGIDSGSAMTKAVLFDEQEIVDFRMEPSGSTPGRVIHRLYEELRTPDTAFVVATGYGRALLPEADKSITEITCHGPGPLFLSGCDTVIDIGGQDSKVILLDPSGGQVKGLPDERQVRRRNGPVSGNDHEPGNVSGGGGGGEYGAGAVHPPPCTPYTKALIAAIPIPDPRWNGPAPAACCKDRSPVPWTRLPAAGSPGAAPRHRPLPDGEAGTLRHGRWPPGGLPSVPVTAVVSHFPMKRRHPSFFVVLPVPTGAV